MKKLILPFILFLLVAAIAIVIYRGSVQKKNSLTTDKTQIGVQKDAHGCIASAGYSWCEAKQKCLQASKESCQNTATVDYSSWSTYRNTDFGFEIKFPKTWDGYKVSEGSYPTYSYVSFSFQDPHQPFSIIEIVRRTSEEFAKITKTDNMKIVYIGEKDVLTCDGCCGQDTNFTGGGQFDNFQIARCKEGTEIMKTFTIIR